MDLSQYSLFPATPEQVRESRVRTHPQWGRGVPLEDYLERDAKLDTFEHAANGRLSTWVLAPCSDPHSLDFLCACETYAREGFVLLPGESAAREETMFGIASVYTPPRHRRRGAARHMMRLLHRVLAAPDALPPFPASWGSPPPTLPPGHKYGVASVLYSDVGAKFYSVCGPSEDTRGWEVDSPLGTVFDVTEMSRAFAELGAPGAEITYLGLGDLKALWAQDAQLLKSVLSNFTTDTPLVTYAPWRGIGAFHANLNAFRLEDAGKPPPTQWGVQISSAELAYATWTIEVEAELRTLIFTRLRCPDAQHFAAVLFAAIQTASAHGLRFIETWNLPEHLLDAAKTYGGRTQARTELLPSIAWYGPGESAKWLNNEKFVWC